MSVYACSDLHGMMELYKQIKAFLKPEDKVYFLGDAGDRGPEPWELIKTIFKDPQFIYMKGNHEDMLYNAIQEFRRYDRLGEEYYLLSYNGGDKTFDGWMAEGETARNGWAAELKNLPTYYTYTNANDIKIHLSHAGFTPFFHEDDTMAQPEEEDLLWDRHHFLDQWHLGDKEMMVHGHTPIPHLTRRLRWSDEKVEPGAFWYCNNHKVCIDNGAFATGITCLFDLDTFDEHIFQVEI